MPRARSPKRDEAYKMWLDSGRKKKLKDIASDLGISETQIRKWKNIDKWNGNVTNQSKGNVTKRKRGGLPDNRSKVERAVEQVMENTDLTDKQRLFCLHYVRCFNATKAYQKAYECSYDVANAEGYKLLVNPCIKAEIDRLKELKRQQIVADAEDIVEIQMRIAFADMGDYVTFGSMGVDLQESAFTDTQMIQEIKEGKNGISIKLSDRQKAIDWLTRYFLMHPESRYKADYERRRAEKEGGETQEFESDGFLEALKGEAAATFEGDDIVET